MARSQGTKGRGRKTASKASGVKKKGRVAKGRAKRSRTAKARTGRGSKRTTISPRGDKRFVRRGKGGQFTESDDVGRSLSRDRGTRAKRTVRSGQGDRGDQAQR
jgi:hypothetical protein